MSLKYQVLTCSQDSRYLQDLVLTLRFDGEAPDANETICLVDAAPDMLEALRVARDLWGDYLPPGNSNAMKAMRLADAAIAKATEQHRRSGGDHEDPSNESK